MINTNIEFDEFVTRLKDKFGFRRKTRCKIQDEDGDGMISVSDQEDLDMAISTSKKNARRDRSEFGKLEVSPPPSRLTPTTSFSKSLIACLLLTCSMFSDLGPRSRLKDPANPDHQSLRFSFICQIARHQLRSVCIPLIDPLLGKIQIALSLTSPISVFVVFL